MKIGCIYSCFCSNSIYIEKDTNELLNNTGQIEEEMFSFLKSIVFQKILQGEY